MSSTQWLNLARQTAVVTGAGSGIGRAVAVSLAGQGCNLLLADVQPDNLTAVSSACHEAASSKILVNTFVCDVTDKSQVQDGIARADELASNDSSSLSSVASILVNCAGITRDSKISNLSIDDWEDVINVNLKGTFLTCQAFCRTDRLTSLLKNSDKRAVGGSIINIGSIVMQYGNIGQVNYAASKGGVVGLTRSLAKEMALFSSKLASSEVADKGAEVLPPTIRVNCIQPGFIHTPMAHAVPERILSEMKRRIAMRRLGRPEEIANLALFLASHERSGYITGEVMECSGMLRL